MTFARNMHADTDLRVVSIVDGHMLTYYYCVIYYYRTPDPRRLLYMYMDTIF